MSDNPSSQSAPITPLERRAIEIQVAIALHKAAVEIVGLEIADRIFSSAVHSLARAAATDISEAKELSLGDLWQVWLDLGGDGRLDLHLDALDERTLRFHVGGCAYAELYKELGADELGVAFSCRRDKPFAEALVPGVKVEQSQTILEGSSRCEFTYTLEGR